MIDAVKGSPDVLIIGFPYMERDALGNKFMNCWWSQTEQRWLPELAARRDACLAGSCGHVKDQATREQLARGMWNIIGIMPKVGTVPPGPQEVVFWEDEKNADE